MATSMFVKFCRKTKGIIEGECTDKGHEKWCVITSLSQTFNNKTLPPPTIPKRAPVAKTCKPEAISIKKIVDKASGELMRMCWYCEQLEEVVIECFRASPGQRGETQPIKYFSIELKGVTIKEFEFEVDEGDLVTEDLDLVADRAVYTYTEMHKERGTAIPFGSATIITGSAK